MRPPAPANPRATGRLVTVGLWVTALLIASFTYDLTNDHFHRISSARQIARYGELPFRDFFDPGYFLTLFSSAAIQLALGDHLLGEMLLNVAFIATGAVFVLTLARRVSGSSMLGVAAALIALLAHPRAYDYDKFLFYPLGLWLSWCYVDRQTFTNLLWLAGGIVLAGLFRYDNAVYMFGAAVVAMAVAHADWSTSMRRIALLVAAAAVIAAPFVWFVGYYAGIGNAADQVIAYAIRERARRILAVPSLSLSALARGEAESVWTLVYYALLALPVFAAATLLARMPSADRAHRARVWSLITMCLLLDAFILRDPVGARVGGMAGPPAVLAASLLAPAARLARPTRLVAAVVALVAVAIPVALVTLDSAPTRDRLRPGRIIAALRARTTSPAPLESIPPRLKGMVAYVRHCTNVEDRVFATWYAPDLYFYAQRAFAAGMVVTFGQQWSEPRFQRRSVQMLAAQSVPVVMIRQIPGEPPFEAEYGLIAAYLKEHYRVGGKTDFAEPDARSDRYLVLIRQDREPTGIDASTSLPCFLGSKIHRELGE